MNCLIQILFFYSFCLHLIYWFRPIEIICVKLSYHKIPLKKKIKQVAKQSSLIQPSYMVTRLQRIPCHIASYQLKGYQLGISYTRTKCKPELKALRKIGDAILIGLLWSEELWTTLCDLVANISRWKVGYSWAPDNCVCPSSTERTTQLFSLSFIFFLPQYMGAWT